MIEWRSAGNTGPFGDPNLSLVVNPVAALAGLSSLATNSSTFRLRIPAQEALRLNEGALSHIQGLTLLGCSDGERCLALCHDDRSGRTGTLVFAALTNPGLRYRSCMQTPWVGRPVALGGWGNMLAVACEDPSGSARILLYSDPVGKSEPGILDEYMLAALGKEASSTGEGIKARWMAWTRLVCGRYLGLVGGGRLGRPYGWAVVYAPSQPRGNRFSPLGCFGVDAPNPCVLFHGAGLGDVANANFLVGTEGRINLVAVESVGHLGRARFKLFVAEPASRDVPLRLRFAGETTLHSRGSSSFRYGSCVTACPNGALAALCSERGVGAHITLYQVVGRVPPEG